MIRPRCTHRRFYVGTKEGSVLMALAAPGQSWRQAIDAQIANYRAHCAALGSEPMSLTVTDRVKL